MRAFVRVVAAGLAVSGCGRVDSVAPDDDAGPVMVVDGGASDATSTTSASGSLPSGTWYKCAWLTSGWSYGGSAWLEGTLTLASQGSSTVATFQGEPGEQVQTATVTLRATSDRSAMLGLAGQQFSGVYELCAGDGGGGGVTAIATPTVGLLDLSSATLSLGGSGLFLDVTGTLDDSARGVGCLSAVAPLVSGTIACPFASIAGGGTSLPSSAEGTVGTSSFAPGVYDCIDTTSYGYESGPDAAYGTQYAVASLTLTSSGSVLTAVYDDDDSGNGTLDFDVTSAASATAVSGQTTNVTCGFVNDVTPGPTTAFATTQLSTGELSADGTNLTLTYFGSVPSGACNGQTSITTLSCRPH